MKVKIYAEGGGEGQLYDTLFRKGWREFFEKANLRGRMPSVIRGKGRARTFDLFRTAIIHGKPDELPLLLVDSEDAVGAGHTVWQHLKIQDDWDRPDRAGDDQAFLMVQVMETWFLADREMLRTYFGPEFRENHIPGWPDLESVPKATAFDTLEKATAGCDRKQYRKGKISFEMLARLDPSKIEIACPHAKKLLDRLRKL